MMSLMLCVKIWDTSLLFLNVIFIHTTKYLAIFAGVSKRIWLKQFFNKKLVHAEVMKPIWALQKDDDNNFLIGKYKINSIYIFFFIISKRVCTHKLKRRRRKKKDKIKFPKRIFQSRCAAVRMWGKPKSRSWKICFTSFINASEWSSTCSRWQHAVDEKKSHKRKRNHERRKKIVFQKLQTEKFIIFPHIIAAVAWGYQIKCTIEVVGREHFNNELPMKKYVHKIWDEIMCHRHGVRIIHQNIRLRCWLLMRILEESMALVNFLFKELSLSLNCSCSNYGN